VSSQYDNPAGRLYELLRRFNEAPDKSIAATWQAILGTETPVELSARLAAVAALLQGIERDSKAAGSRPARDSVNRYSAVWQQAVLPFQHRIGQDPKSTVQVPEEALEALDAVAEILSVRVPDGKVPDDDELRELRERVDEVVSMVRDSEDIPDDVKDLVLEHLRQVLHALTDLSVIGPRGVTSAVAQFVGSMNVAEAQEPGRISRTLAGVEGKIVPVLVALWVAFAAGPNIQNDAAAWDGILHGHLSAPAQIEPGPTQPLLGPGSGH
jgi:hypothetical protein